MQNRNHLVTILTPVFSVLILIVGLGLTGCEEEIGCTNRNSDNYNPDAVRDNGTCINARDKFLGVYRAVHVCDLDTFNGELSDPLNFDTLQLVTIIEDELREQEDDIELKLFGPDSLTVKALVSRHEIRIPTQGLDVRGIPMNFIGEGFIDNEGYITILYTALPAYEDCVLFMYRIDG
ncbi:MAG: hypothetical protein ACI85F_002120 [Bacteroidia bacterium]|jgi:hypothetical protein